MSLTSLILTAIENGINQELLLRSTGIDFDTFNMKLTDNEFTHDESVVIKAVIKQWESMGDLR